jgi:plastocyanin
MTRLIALLLATAVVGAGLAASALAATRTVAVKDNFFAPKSMIVSQGTTVRWVWRGRAPHNVTVISGPARFRSSTQTTGTYAKRLTRRGTYQLHCTIHPGMDQTLKVR